MTIEVDIIETSDSYPQRFIQSVLPNTPIPINTVVSRHKYTQEAKW